MTFTSWRGIKPNKLIIDCTKTDLQMALVGRGVIKKRLASICLRETPHDILIKRLQAIVTETGASRVTLMLSRNQLIEKDFRLACAQSELSGLIETRLKQDLPLDISEVAHGIALRQTAADWHVRLALLPEDVVERWCKLFESVGLQVADVLPRDEAVLACCQQSFASKKVLVIVTYADDAEWYFLNQGFIEKGKAIASLRLDVIEDVQLEIMACDEKPDALCLIGKVDIGLQRALESSLGVSATVWDHTDGLSTLMASAAAIKSPMISLLSNARKARHAQSQRVRRRKCLSGLVALWLVIVLGGVLAHAATQAAALERVLQQRDAIDQPWSATLRWHTQRQQQAALRASGRRVLDTLLHISQVSPKEVTLEEFSFEKDKIYLRGESPSHGSITALLLAVKQSPDIEDGRLEYARLRKEQGREHFQFRIRLHCLSQSHALTLETILYNAMDESFARNNLQLQQIQLAAMQALIADSERHFPRTPHDRSTRVPHASSDLEGDWLRELDGMLRAHALSIEKMQPAPTSDASEGHIAAPIMVSAMGASDDVLAFLHAALQRPMVSLSRLRLYRQERQANGNLFIEVVLSKGLAQVSQLAANRAKSLISTASSSSVRSHLAKSGSIIGKVSLVSWHHILSRHRIFSSMGA